MEIQEAIDYIRFVIEQHNDDMLFKRWIASYQGEQDFESFKAGLIAKTREPKSKEEILKQTEEILASVTRDKKWKSLNSSEQYS